MGICLHVCAEFGVAPFAQRLSTAAVLFSQASCGKVQSLQSASLCLFAALEALFGSKKIYNGSELGPLIGNALRNLSFPFDVSSWVKDEFNGRRNDLAHGVQDVLPWMTAARPEKWEAFGRLHEVTRAAILGFLSQPDVKLTQFSKANTNIRRKLLEQMPPFDHTVGCLQGFIPQCA